MVGPGKLHRVHILRGEVAAGRGRKGVRPVVVVDEGFKVLILHHNIGQPALQLLNEPKQPPQIKGLGGERFPFRLENS